jgi:serine/threonine-protein kinase SRPK3
MEHIRSFFQNTFRKDIDFKLIDFPVTGYDVIPAITALEEQKTRAWHTGQYAPIRLGDLLDFRYQIVSKLSYDEVSTTWLAVDVLEVQYACVRVFVRGGRDSDKLVKKYNDLYARRHDLGDQYDEIVVPIDVGTLEKTGHAYVVTRPVSQCMLKRPSSVEPGNINGISLQKFVRHVLKVLDHLHTNLHIIHNGIHPTCSYHTIRSPILDARVKQELTNPCSRKFVDGFAIYQSCPIAYLENEDDILLGNLDGAVMVDLLGGHHPDMVPVLDFYSSPERIIADDYSYQSDTWSLGCVVVELLSGEVLFPALNSQQEYSSSIHIEQNLEFLNENYVLPRDGQESVEVPSQSDGKSSLSKHLEALVEKSGVARGDMLLKMLRDMLTCNPNCRKTAREILLDEESWVNAELEEKWWKRRVS